MDSYELKNERIARLRKVILFSANAIPEEVTTYVHDVAARSRSWKEKEQLLKEFHPIAQHLPAAFVDFALGYLIEKERRRDFGWSDDDPGRLGIREVIEYMPAAPVQGPFLYLLQKHEREGLRLVHGLVNAATARWREVRKRGDFVIPPTTPIPLILDFSGKKQTFWGDDSVYCWYRGTAVGPHVVVSALMALEMWIETQLASGRDVSELLRTVLEGAECVAVLGIIVSIALANPGKALEVLAPLVADSHLWRMDIVRLTHDHSGTPVIGFMGRHQEINRILSQRNQLSHRRVDIRWLVIHYLFNEQRKDAFLERVRTFGDPLPFYFEEESEDASHVQELREQIERDRAMLDPKNYRVFQQGDGVAIEFVRPQELIERDRESAESFSRMEAILAVKLWARKTLDNGAAAEGMTPLEAMRRARSFQRDDDLSEPSSYLSHGLDHTRVESILEVAAAVLTVLPRSELSTEDLEWLRSVLLKAASMRRSGPMIAETIYSSDLKVSAGVGLGALVTAGLADQDIRVALLSLVCDAEHQVVGAVFLGLRDAWSLDPILCWNCLSLAISMCCIPRTAVEPFSGLTLNASGRDWFTGLWSIHLELLQNDTNPEPPTIGKNDDVFFQSKRLMGILDPLPVPSFGADPRAKQTIVGLLDGLMARTLESVDENSPKKYHSVTDYEWETNFLQWSARVSIILSVEEENEHIIQPIWEAWPLRPRLLQQFLFAYLDERLGSLQTLPDDAVKTWERLWNSLLDSPQLLSRSRWPNSSSSEDEIDTSAVFVSFGRYYWKDTWPHVRRFESLIDRWVRIMGVTHRCYHAFLSMLKPNIERFDPTTSLGWLEFVMDTSKEVRSLMAAYNNGTKTTELLMLLHSRHTEALQQQGLIPKLARLVDTLASVGVPSATLLQRKLEGRE